MWDDPNNHQQWGNMHDGGAWMGMGVLMLVTTVLVVGLLIWIALMLRGLAAQHARGSVTGQTSGAEELLADRLARGEIDTEEFVVRSEALKKARKDLR